ncbi:MAG: hypothetical protein VX197_00490 [Pseudomonadota bacterium]|nr:hypothetical protein [Pseudomonadota bacterium]
MTEEVGTFSLKFSGNTYSSDENGNVTVHQNWEGAADGYGSVFGTLILGPMSASELNEGGQIKWVGQGFLEDGTTVVGIGEGTFETPPDQHVARTLMLIDISDGTKIRSEGEMALETLTWTGTNTVVE